MLTGYYQKRKKSKERIIKRLKKGIKIFLKKKTKAYWQRYRNISEKENEKKRQYGRGRYKNFLEDKNQRLVQCIKK